jgi:hypothetical protein
MVGILNKLKILINLAKNGQIFLIRDLWKKALTFYTICATIR